jgi:hypothetical protein
MRVLIEFMPALGDFVTQLPVLHALHARIQPGAALLEDYDWVGRRHPTEGSWSTRSGPYLSSYRKPFDLLLYLRSNPTIKGRLLLPRRTVTATVTNAPT